MSGESPDPKKTRQQIGDELFVRLEQAHAVYDKAKHEQRILMDAAGTSLGTADGSYALELAKRKSSIADQALRDYQAALKVCTDYWLKGTLP